MLRKIITSAVLTVGILAGIAACASHNASHAQASSRVAKTVVTPYAGSDGTQGVGLEVKGSHGFGGTPLMVTDYTGAPEVWVNDGSLYVGYKKGWLGGDLCIDNDLKSNVCLTYNDLKTLTNKKVLAYLAKIAK